MANVIVSRITDTSGTGYFASQAYFECGTAAATATKAATRSDLDPVMSFTDASLVKGVTVFVKFTNGNTANNAKLKVGTSTAKNIYRYGTTAPSNAAIGTGAWQAGSVVSFTYDGSAWIMNDHNIGSYVTQNGAITTNGSYAVLLSSSATTTIETQAVNKTSTLLYNPSTQVLSAGSFSGSGSGLSGVRGGGYYATFTSGDSAQAALGATITPALSSFSLVAGCHVFIPTTSSINQFISAYSYTLNLNSSGNILIKYKGAQLGSGVTLPKTQTTYPVGTVLEFMYDGTNWLLISDEVDRSVRMMTCGLTYSSHTSLSQGYSQIKYTISAGNKIIPNYDKVIQVTMGYFSNNVVMSGMSTSSELFYSIPAGQIISSGATVRYLIGASGQRFISWYVSGSESDVTVYCRSGYEFDSYANISECKIMYIE